MSKERSDRLVILDRDGVINEDSDQYIKNVSEWHAIDGSLEAIARLSKSGYRVFVASNQAGIGRGLFTYEDLMNMNRHLEQRVRALGGHIEALLFAPEHPDKATQMRKPNPGMLLDIASRMQISLRGVPFVGDTWGDVQAALNAGASPVLVRSGKGIRTLAVHDPGDVPVFDNLDHFAREQLKI